MTRRKGGFGLVELLVAVLITGVALGAAWPLLWQASRTAHAVGERAQAHTAAASALRRISADLRLASSLQPLPDDVEPHRGICLNSQTSSGMSEPILIVWDQDRRVLWRKAPGSYLADRVQSFAVTLVDAQGHELAADAARNPASLASVTLVRVALVVTYGPESVRQAVTLPVGVR